MIAATRLRQVKRALIRRVQARKVLETSLAPNVAAYSGHGERVLGHLFELQKAFIRDAVRRKTARCGRRAGKTTTAAAYLVKECLDFAGCLTGYICPTRKQAKRLIWKELKRLNRHYKLGVSFNETELEATFPNGSVILIAGADKEDSIEKFRGSAFKLVILDESASFRKHIEQLVADVLKPTLEDYQGTIALIGTPGVALVGLFYEATTDAPGWSRHHWTVLDNLKFPLWAGKADWKERAIAWLANLRKEEGYDEDNPTFLREWLAKWAQDTATLIYPYDAGLNFADKLPDKLPWEYVLGVDLGTDDDSAFVVLAFSKLSPVCYIVHAEKAPGMDVEDVAERIKALRRVYKFRSMVVDSGGLGKMVAETLRRKHHLPVKPAEKQHKEAFQADLRSDLHRSRVKVLPGAMAIVTEWRTIQRKDKNTWEEDDRFPNHCADAGLYGYRECRHYIGKTPKPDPLFGTEEHAQKLEAEIIEGLKEDLAEPDEVATLWG